VGKESLVWLVRSAIERSNLARDGLVDIATTVRCAEETARQIEETKQPASFEDLVSYPNRWTQGRPILPAVTYVTGLGNEAAHVHAILMFDALDWFDRRSKQHGEAFAWLLDKCDSNAGRPADWNGVAYRERLGVIDETRRLMRTHARTAARHGYYLIEQLWAAAESLPPAWRNEHTAIEQTKSLLGLRARVDAGRRARELDRPIHADAVAA
jgi:hypothetical protein